jgi:hypothetical protein
VLYTGYTEDELKELITILERYQVPFEIKANEEAIANAQATISDPHFYHARRGAQLDNSFYSISFERNMFRNLSGADLRELKKLRIFPEEMQEPEEPVEAPAPSLKRPGIMFVGTNPWTGFLVMLGLLSLVWAYFNVRA